MSNSGQKMSTPGWRTFALLGGVLVVAFGAFASATPQDKSKATLVQAAEKTAASTRIDHATKVAGKLKSANSKQNTSATALTEVQTGSSATIGTARPRKLDQPSRSNVASATTTPAGRRTAQGGGGTITCSVDDQIVPLNSVACNTGGVTTANQFARCFDGATFFAGGGTVTSLNFGVEIAEDGGSGNPNLVTVSLYSIPACGVPNPLPDAQLTLLGSAQIDLGIDGSANGTIQTVVFAPPIVVPAGTNVVGEIAYGDDTRIWPGSNPNGQSCLSYIAADACGLSDLTDLAAIGFPDMHLVLNLNVQLGTCGEFGCEEGEDSCNCPQDCGAEGCGNGICCGAQGEDCATCPEDCDDCPSCGDGNVDPGEDCDPPGSLCANGEICQGDCTCPGLGNNDCADRVEIFDGVTPIDTTTATTDGLPTNGLGDCAAFGDPQIHNDIWYNYTATCTGELTVSTCDTVDYDSKIALYEDCDVGLCPRGGDEIGCNDDGPGCAGFSTFMTANVLLDSCYKIRIGGFSAGDAGTGTVDISCTVPTVCGDGVCEGAENACSCPVDCPGECACSVFTNQAEFEAFNQGEGKTLKGIEDFEEGTLGPGGIAGVDDPLCGGIPSSPPGSPYPNGLTQLNMCFQSNFEHNPGAPNPRGLVGIAALGTGALGTSSEGVVANFFVDSADLMFTSPPALEEDDHTGIGFNIVALQGGTSVDLQVYDKANSLVVSASSPADAAGSNFWGVWCSDPIGRININGDGFSEGADNIQLWHDITCDPPCDLPATCIDGACCGDGVVEGHEECDFAGCGTCPWDTFPVDGVVGAGDLAFLLGNWGPIPPDADPAIVCLDAEPDGNIGAFDLANLLGNWGACPVGFGEDQCVEADCLENCECVGRGACCGVKGNPEACDADLTAAECAAANGTYAGDDTTCEDCPDPACFDAEGSCFEPHGGPGCANPVCCAIVCNIDPICCEEWDSICVAEAEELCPPPECGDGICEGDEDPCNCDADCAGPCNDDCEDKLPIFDGVTPYSTLGMTTDGLDTNCLNDCCGFGQPQIENDIWYCYTATCSGILTVSTCDTVDYDSKIAIYDSCDPGLCPRGGDEIGCNDDGPGCAGFTTIAEATVLAGNTYNIRIGGFELGATGSGTVNISCEAPGVCGDGDVDPGEDCDPPGSLCANGEICQGDCTCPGLANDDCEDRLPITDGDTFYDTTGTTTDGPVHPECQFDGQTYHDIWYNYNASCSGTLTVSTCNQANYDTDLVVYNGCDCNNLVLLGCNDDDPACAGFSSRVIVPVSQGNCYKIRVGGWNPGDQGSGTLSVSCN